MIKIKPHRPLMGISLILVLQFSCCVYAQLSNSVYDIAPASSANGEQAPHVVSFTYDFFSVYQPDTALDMVRQVPGFELDDGEDSRGFVTAAGNILINGRRPSSKEDSPSAILGRIPASQVDRIELIRGQVRGIDLRGQSVVANIFLREDVPAAVRWETAFRKHFDVDRIFMTGDISVSDRVANIDYNLGFFFERNANGESGVEDIFDASNQLTEIRDDNILQTGHEGTVNLNASSWVGETLLQVNMEFNILNGDGTEFSRRIPQLMGDGNPRTVTIRDNDSNMQIELGGDAERSLTDTMDGKLILLYFHQDKNTLSTQETIDNADNLISLRRANNDTKTTEVIGRVELDWTAFSEHAVQLNLERAFNAVEGSLIQAVDDGSGAAIVDVPGANTRVEEVRWDITFQDTWTLGDFELEYGLSTEFSTISQSGDADQKRNFSFIKPHSVLSYSPEQQLLTKIRLAREVSQLDFNDFISATVFEDDDLALGNPDLGPESTWLVEASHERRFGTLGVIKLTVFHHWISDVLDLLPVTEEFEAPGNIGNGRRWGVELASTLPLESLGLAGARLDINARWQDSTVVDPVTGEDRVLSGEKGFSGFSRTSNNAFRYDYSYALIFDFRQDLELARIAWGWVVRTRSERKLFNVNELDIYDEDVEIDAFIETTRWLGVKMSMIGENLTNATQLRNRTVFSGQRSLSALNFREIERDRDGRRIILQISGSF